ncbi:MAG: DUF4364 family protein [Oscillospiraceae bacterium]|nr:DUF4364 family protein [Oscillospiraceae bacterium]
MESEIFLAGVRPGGVDTEDQVKVLICYILSQLGEGMDFDQLYDALSQYNLVNYFELVCALDKLTDTGHLAREKKQGVPAVYTVTKLGKHTEKELERSLPLAVRERALDAGRRLLARERRLREVKISRTPSPGGGFILELSIPEKEGEMLTLRVFAPSEEVCGQITRQFLNSPLTIYKGVMALLTGNEQLLGQIFTQEEKLF